jgi:WD40 repeat protein
LTAVAYQVGGCLPPQSPLYIWRQADEDLYQALLVGKFCYVLNARQMGKSSLRMQAITRLREAGFCCCAIDLTAIGTQQVTVEQWYAAIFALLCQESRVKINRKQWWRDRQDIPPVARLAEFIETVLLVEVKEPIVIFIDEIDSLLNLQFSTEDFFALIRNCYDRRADDVKYQRLTFALFGVATPGELIADKSRTPFNLGCGISLQGFQKVETAPLAQGLASIFSEPDVVLQRILYWSGGQPFLTQKLCDLVVSCASSSAFAPPTLSSPQIEAGVDRCVNDYILHNWEAQDQPEHLKTIRDRLLHDERRVGELLSLYRQIWESERQPTPENLIPVTDSSTQVQLLLSGIVEKRNGYLRIKNPIYRQVFNLAWIDHHLDLLRPYASQLQAWIASNYEDTSRLLRGKALEEAWAWSQNKNLGEIDYHYLNASQKLEQQEIQQELELEKQQETKARLDWEKKSVRRQRQLIAVLSIALVAAIALGSITFAAYRQVAISQIEALVAASEGNFASHQRLDALVQALQARQQFQNLRFVSSHTHNRLEEQTQQTLAQVIYQVREFNRMLAHPGGNAMGVDFSPDGRWIASSGADRTVKIWRRDGRLVRTLNHDAPVYKLQFDRNSQRLAIPTLNGDIFLQSVTNASKQLLSGHQAAVWNVAWRPDGSKLASASSDGTVKIWSADGQLLKSLTGHQAAVWDIAWHPNGNELASASVDGTIKRWQADGSPIETFQNTNATVWSILYSHDGETLISAHADQKIRLWQCDGTLIKTLNAHEAEVFDLALSPDGKYFASVSADKTIKLWLANGNLLQTFLGHRGNIRSLAFSPDGTELASAAEDSFVKLWQLESQFAQPLYEHKGVAWQVAYAPSSSPLFPQFATTGRNKVCMWQQLELNTCYDSLGSQKMYSMAFHPQEAALVVGNAQGSIYHMKFPKPEINRWQAHDVAIFGLDYSPDGRWLVSGGDDANLKLWRQNDSGEYILHQTISAHAARIWDVTFSPDGSYIVSSSIDGTVKLWGWNNSETKQDSLPKLAREPQQVLQGHKTDIWEVAISSNSQKIASASRDGKVNLWSRDGKLLQTIAQSQRKGFVHVAFSPRDRYLAAAKTDNTIDIYNLKGEQLTNLKGHDFLVTTLAFRWDGKYLLSGGYGSQVIRWNWENISSVDLMEYGCNWIRDYVENSESQDFKASLCRNY